MVWPSRHIILASTFLVGTLSCSKDKSPPPEYPPVSKEAQALRQAGHLKDEQTALDAGLPARAQGTQPPTWSKTYKEYAVAAGHPLASKAGAEVLAAGGSAADGIVAAMLAMGVASPVSSGLGGGGFATYYDAKSGKVSFFDFRETAPRKASADMFVEASGGKSPEPGQAPSQFGGLASGVPGEAAGMAELLKSYGKASRDAVFAPAIRYAEEGIPVSHHMAKFSKLFGPQMVSDKTLATWFVEGDTSLREGATLKQPELAKTMRLLSDKGFSAFYRGEIAKQIVEANKKAGGILTVEDLRSYRVKKREAISANAFGYRFVTAPLPSAGGYILAESLRFLEGVQTAQARQSVRVKWGAPYLHALIESWKGPYLDRIRYFGDPDKVKVPLDKLTTKERREKRVAKFNAAKAKAPTEYELPLKGEKGPRTKQPNDRGTSHICVVDKDGNVASATTTVNMPFGARYTAAGFIMNDEMDDFARGRGQGNAWDIEEGAKNLPGPGKRPLSSMSPTIVFKGDRPALCIGGGAGGTRIPTALLQVALGHLVLGMPLHSAVEAPRVHHQSVPADVRHEEDVPMPSSMQKALKKRGHKLSSIRFIASVQAIGIEHSGDGKVSKLTAAADPRKGGVPAGR